VLTYEAVSFGGDGVGAGGDGVGSGAFGSGAFGAGVSAAAILTAASEGEPVGFSAKTAPGTYAEDSPGAMETPDEYASVGTGAASTTGAALGAELLPPAFAPWAYPGPLRMGGLPGSDVNFPEVFKDLIARGSSILQVL